LQQGKNSPKICQIVLFLEKTSKPLSNRNHFLLIGKTPSLGLKMFYECVKYDPPEENNYITPSLSLSLSLSPPPPPPNPFISQENNSQNLQNEKGLKKKKKKKKKTQTLSNENNIICFENDYNKLII
jgi:hypothetical protein